MSKTEKAASSVVIQITKPPPPTIVEELRPIVEVAKDFKVFDVASHAESLERIRDLRKGGKAITEYFEPARKAADQAKKEILAARDGLIAPLAQAVSIYDNKACAYEAEERRQAEEQERKLREEARKREEEQKLLDAIDAEESGDSAAAEAILQEATDVPEVYVAPKVAQVKGISMRATWSAEVHDFAALVAYVAQHEEWINLLAPNQTALNKLAVAQHEALSIPGVRAVSQTVRATR